MNRVSFLKPLAMTLCVMAAPDAPAPASAASPAPYKVEDGAIIIPEWDDLQSTKSCELLRLGAKIFAKTGKIYRDALLLEGAPAVSEPVQVPEKAEEIVLLGRSTPDQHIFPRIRLTLEAEGKKRVLYEGFAPSLSTLHIGTPLPPDLKGQEVRLRVEMLNPSPLNEIRTYRLTHVIFRGPCQEP